VTIASVNDVPQVADAGISTNINTPLVNSVSTLAFDGDGDPLTFAVVTQPAHGTLSLSADGNFTYTPTAGFFGTDSFTYRANDGLVNSNTAKLTITVTNVDVPLKLTLPTNTPVTLRASMILILPSTMPALRLR
jgi:VCBS repeat-containing protein